MTNKLTRRSFVKWSTVVAGGAAIAGFAGCSPQSSEETTSSSVTGDPVLTGGEWKTGACMNNCSCGASRCLLRVYVKDGVPIRVYTDEDDSDGIEMPQRRACLRGRAQISNMLSPARIKYPMKRKNWSPDNPNKELRGKDEWERISWEEALDYIGDEMKKTIDEYGTRGIFCGAYSDIGDSYFDPMVCLINHLGGAMHPEMGTVSFGSWPVTEQLMTGGLFSTPYPPSLAESDLHVMFGLNWAVNKAGNTPHYLDYAREKGGKIIVFDPWLSQTAQALADEWVPVLPGTDTALIIAMAYHQITNSLHAQDYLDKYTIGFDGDHMPEGADPKDNFKDYVLGTYDNEPKTPEWAEKICGVPAAKIKELAEEIANTDKVNFYAEKSSTKVPAGEMLAQVFYTFALMHGGIGTPGNYMSWDGLGEGKNGSVSVGDYSNAAGNPVNPLTPEKFTYMFYPIPTFSAIEDMSSWDVLDFTELWDSILAGEYGRDIWPGGKRKINIKHIYTGGYTNTLNQAPHANAGIEVFRSVDFAWGANPFFDPSRQYCDIVLPVASWWEKGNLAFGGPSEVAYWYDRIMEPMYESKPESYIAEELAKRLGVDPRIANSMTEDERTYASLADAKYTAEGESEGVPLFTITQADIDDLGVKGEPQEGVITVAEFKEKGCFKVPHPNGIPAVKSPYAAFYEDPEKNPLTTASGKFEIYCASLAHAINTVGFSTISPIGKWQASSEQGVGSQTTEYPLLLWTPHSLRRAHSVNDNVISLREAFPQECFVSTIDAEERGIKTGDTVLMSSPYGKVLRPAKVIPTLVPGAVAMGDGSWMRIDEQTGIDLGGCPNILQAPKTSGQACTPWTGTLLQVEKYTGNLNLVPDKDCPIVMPVGIE